MDSQPLPPPLEQLATRPFSFYPPIVGIEHNEWEYRQCTWSEILVANRPSGMELWIPRRFFGDVSTVDDPVLIAGLTRELEFSGGMLHPYKPRLVRMPSSGVSFSAPAEPLRPFKGLKMETGDKRVVTMMAIAVGGLILICVLAVAGLRIGTLTGRRVVLTASDQSYTLLNSRDDHFGVVSKIGAPTSDRTKEVGTVQYEALSYPQRKYTVILMGTDIKTVKYIGTMNDKWEPLHWTTEYTNALLSSSLTRF
jgi:hypothetical protein